MGTVSFALDAVAWRSPRKSMDVGGSTSRDFAALCMQPRCGVKLREKKLVYLLILHFIFAIRGGDDAMRYCAAACDLRSTLYANAESRTGLQNLASER